jgi:hypothetical protein
MRTSTESPLVSTQPSTNIRKPAPIGGKPPLIGSSSSEVIDTKSYFKKAEERKLAPAEQVFVPDSNWLPAQLRAVPAFYPLEKSSRLVEDESSSDIAARLSHCLRALSVHATYDNASATASLLTSENVEMHLSLWKTPTTSSTPGVVVELQRRKGDSIIFHRYSRTILDAAVGELDPLDLSPELLDDIMYSKKVQRLLAMELKNQNHQEHENAIIAIEIAHGLLMKDRMDARRLGLESLCLLTDPQKTGYVTAVLASHVVLLGTTQGVDIPGLTEDPPEGPFQDIREAILGLVQFSRIGEDEHEEGDMEMPVEAEHMTLLHNLALAVLANALDVVENPEPYDDEPEVVEDSKPRGRLRTSSSSDVANDFLKKTEDISDKEILSTLISELGKAKLKPHNATLSAKCIGSLCRASDDAKKRAKELGAKTVVSTALDVGTRTHLKLETECKKVVKSLQRPNHDEESSFISS